MEHAHVRLAVFVVDDLEAVVDNEAVAVIVVCVLNIELENRNVATLGFILQC